MKVGDDISTDEIMPTGSEVLPYRSNIPKISEWVFDQVEQGFYKRAQEQGAPWRVVGGSNYGQGSSREHSRETSGRVVRALKKVPHADSNPHENCEFS